MGWVEGGLELGFGGRAGARGSGLGADGRRLGWWLADGYGGSGCWLAVGRGDLGWWLAVGLGGSGWCLGSGL